MIELVSEEQRQATKDAQGDLRRAPEAIGAMALSAIWPLSYLSVAPSVTMLVVVLLLSALGVGLTAVTINNGSQGWLMWAAGYLAALAVAAIAALDLNDVGVVASSSTVILYLDLVRLNFARRRTEQLDEKLVMRTLGASLVVTVLAIASVVLAFTVAGGSDGDETRSWIWVPIATAVVVVPGLALIIGSARKSGQHDKRRWTPGERMLPQPNID